MLHQCTPFCPDSSPRPSLVVEQDLVGVWDVEVLGVSGLHTS